MSEIEANKAELADIDDLKAALGDKAKAVKKEAAELAHQIACDRDWQLGKLSELQDEKDSRAKKLQARNEFLRLLIGSS